MAENTCFQKALANFTAEFAYVGAVKHLHDLGLPPEKIREQLSYPVSLEKIQQVIQEYEKEKANPEAAVCFVRDTDPFGRKSFRMVKKDGNAQNI